MKLTSIFTLVAAALFVASCSSKPEPNFVNTPGKFQTNAVQSDLFEITYSGTAGMSTERAMSIAGQRASALCIAQGYQYFIVLEKSAGFEPRPPQPGAAPDSLAAVEHQVPVVKGQLRFFKKQPSIETQAVYDATQTQQTMNAFN